MLRCGLDSCASSDNHGASHVPKLKCSQGTQRSCGSEVPKIPSEVTFPQPAARVRRSGRSPVLRISHVPYTEFVTNTLFERQGIPLENGSQDFAASGCPRKSISNDEELKRRNVPSHSKIAKKKRGVFWWFKGSQEKKKVDEDVPCNTRTQRDSKRTGSAISYIRPKNKINGGSSSNDCEQRYWCSECPYSHSNFMVIRRHRLDEHGLRSFACRSCFCVFPSFAELRQHKLNVHFSAKVSTLALN